MALVTSQVIYLSVTLTLLFALCHYFNRTDVPKIKGLPEIPGVPIFGNLLQLGSSHAEKCAELSKTYGPVFQVRMGNKVCSTLFHNENIFLTLIFRESLSQIPLKASKSCG
jgi:hypothetical protein